MFNLTEAQQRNLTIKEIERMYLASNDRHPIIDEIFTTLADREDVQLSHTEEVRDLNDQVDELQSQVQYYEKLTQALEDKYRTLLENVRKALRDSV